MQRRNFLVAFGIAAISVPLSSCTTEPASSDAVKSGVMGAASSSLLPMLTSSLGVTQNQAEGGVGSILKLAQEKLVKGDFDQIAAAIPGASKYLETAKTLGAFAGNLNNLAGLNGALGKLGISPDVAAKFIPAVTDFVSKAGGSKVGGLLKSVLI